MYFLKLTDVVDNICFLKYSSLETCKEFKGSEEACEARKFLLSNCLEKNNCNESFISFKNCSLDSNYEECEALYKKFNTCKSTTIDEYKAHFEHRKSIVIQKLEERKKNH